MIFRNCPKSVIFDRLLCKKASLSYKKLFQQHYSQQFEVIRPELKNFHCNIIYVIGGFIMKSKKVWVAIMLSIGLIGGGTIINKSVSANTWRFGAPKILRGHYIFHRKEISQWGYINIHKTWIREQSQGDPYLTYTRLRYHKISTYTYHYHAWVAAPKASGGTPGYESFTITKRGHYLWLNHWRYIKEH